MHTSRVNIEHLKPGMYVVALDQPWHKTPFWSHHFLIKDEEQIACLKQCGVRIVVIDISRGRDVEVEGGQAQEGRAKGEAQGSPLPLHLPDCAAPADSIRKGVRHRAAQEGCQTPRFTDNVEERFAAAGAVRTEAVRAVDRVFEGIKTGIPLRSEELRQVVNNLLSSLLDTQETMSSLVQLEQMQRFEYALYAHVVDTCVLALVVGKAHGLDHESLQQLGLGTLLHDIGQMRLPRNLFRKPGAYTEQERRLVQRHPSLGAEIVSRARDVPEAARRIVEEHHERLDGSGYPRQLSGAQLSIFGQIVGILETYDGLVSSRYGRPPTPPARAVRQIYQLGIKGQFFMWIVERVIHCLGVYPVGSLVELTTGERGWVMAVNPDDRLTPTVKLLWNKGGEMKKRPVIVTPSLTASDQVEQTIARVLDPVEEGVDLSTFGDKQETEQP